MKSSAARRPQLAPIALVAWYAKAGSCVAIEFEQGTGEPVSGQSPAPGLLPPTLSPPHSAQSPSPGLRRVLVIGDALCTEDTCKTRLGKILPFHIQH